MGVGSRVVDGLVIGFALFFVFIGGGLVYFGASGEQITGSGVDIEGGPSLGKTLLGGVFLLAAAPMFYFVFSPSAKSLPPAKRKARPPSEPGVPPSPPP